MSSADPARPLIIVDAANVVGSVPDGWWRDRPGANVRLRDAISSLGETGLPDLPGPVDVVLVVEGAARSVASVPGVEVVSAAGSGDDAIVGVVAEHPDRRRVVVTADRGLRERVRTLGADVVGPTAIRRR